MRKIQDELSSSIHLLGGWDTGGWRMASAWSAGWLDIMWLVLGRCKQMSVHLRQDTNDRLKKWFYVPPPLSSRAYWGYITAHGCLECKRITHKFTRCKWAFLKAASLEFPAGLAGCSADWRAISAIVCCLITSCEVGPCTFCDFLSSLQFRSLSPPSRREGANLEGLGP